MVESNSQIQDQSHFDIFKTEGIANAIYGSVLGAFAGDAAGSYVEFSEYVAEDQANEAVKMVGKGVYNLGPGQVTDDSEQAMCILHGLTDTNLRFKKDDSMVVNIDGIACYFAKWLNDELAPFDVGMTTGAAFSTIPYEQSEVEFLKKFSFDTTIKSTISESQSNGCLMRITPLAAFCHKLKKEDLKKAVFLETMLTHSHIVAKKACYLYCYAISIIVNEKDPKKAYVETKKEAQQLEKEYKAACDEDNVYNWFEELENEIYPDPTVNIAFLKIAFVFAFYYLRQYYYSDNEGRKDFYLNSIKETINYAGDTDTNACIVGGLIGACVGINGIPKHMVDAVLDFDNDSYQVRPSFLVPKYSLVEKLNEIIKNAPTDLKMQVNNKILTDDEILSYMGK